MIEKRHAKRSECSTNALVTMGKTVIAGSVENLSINGMYLRSEDKLAPYQDVVVKLDYHDGVSDLSVQIEGIVSRSDDNGIGIQFKDMSMQSFKIVKDIVKHYHDNPKSHDKDALKMIVKE